jgi:predicted Fe-Mo cluster-binding NifX family protein
LKVALPYWQDRISPVLDTADNFIIADIRSDNRIESERINLAGKSYSERVQFLKNQGVTLLLCGAVSEYCQEVFISKGIEVIPWLRGSVDCIMEGFLKSNLNEPTFNMPGYRGCRRRRRGGKGRRRNSGNNLR